MRFAAPKQTERWHCTCTAIVQPCSFSVCAASIFIWYCVLCTGVFCRPTLNKKEVSALCFQYVQLTEQKPPNNLKMKWTLPLFGCWKPSPRSNTLKVWGNYSSLTCNELVYCTATEQPKPCFCVRSDKMHKCEHRYCECDGWYYQFYCGASLYYKHCAWCWYTTCHFAKKQNDLRKFGRPSTLL